jgi:bifunctional non-homologous end joining protein LigD
LTVRATRDAASIEAVKLSHPTRVFYPEIGLTKRGLADFYVEIAEWALPSIAGRPLTLVRCENGIQGDCTYMRHSRVWGPPALRRISIPEKKKLGQYLVVDDVAGLVSLVQMDILEIHTWNSTAADVEHPDRLVFDLDPEPDVPWPTTIEAARRLRTFLEELGLRSFLKTTGGAGLHLVVPLKPAHSWDACLGFARSVAKVFAAHDPDRLTVELPKQKRSGKILIDYLRNNRANTSIAAYSTRARPGAPVSTPIAWDELTPRLRSDGYTIANLPRRLRRLRTDPWPGYHELAQTIPQVQFSGAR